MLAFAGQHIRVNAVLHGKIEKPMMDRFTDCDIKKAINLGSGLIDQSQKMTEAAMQMADMKVCAHLS